MLELYFKDQKEANAFCDYFFQQYRNIELQWVSNANWGNRLQLKKAMVNEQMLESIGHSLVEIFKDFRLSGMIKYVIKKVYYYTDWDEIERILELSHWIISEGKHWSKKEDFYQIVKELFMDHLRESQLFHFDSIVKFRFTFLKERLIDYVGLAIDEFKREEDHQAFVNTIREYIQRKSPRCKEIHLLQGENFLFFKANGAQFSKKELLSLMEKEPLYLFGLDHNEWDLSPLIALSPQSIHIYGDHPSEPKTLTVINIFQERAIFKPVKQFPFLVQ